jgi:bifunctional oligoribonuclease and PAP phosphatase NrnA
VTATDRPAWEGALDEVARRIEGARKLLLACHLGPDGDSLGSMSALASLLRERGREATLYNPDHAPRNLRWLPHVRTLVHKLAPETRYEMTIVVDCGDRRLLGEKFPPPEVTGPLVVLDHHASSRPFGEVTVCDPGAASVGVLVARLARRLGWTLSADAAQGIYVSLVADTGSFRYSNTDAEAFQLAADLVAERGVEPWGVAERLGEQVPLARWRLLARVLGGIELELDGKVAVMVVTEELVKGAGAGWEDTEGLVNYARAIEGVECGVLLSPARNGGVRCSLRSKGRAIDAGAVCAGLGGGGHPGAAGCTLEGDLPAARARVLDALAAALRR